LTTPLTQPTDRQIKLLVISDYSHTVGVRPEAEIILGLQRTGKYEITIMTGVGSEYARIFAENGIRIIGFLPVKKISLGYIKKIKNELTNGKYHILQLFNNRGMTNGLLAAIGVNVKVVVYRGYTGNISWADPTMYIKYLSPRVDRIICLVDAIRDIFRKNLFFNKDKAITINKGHDIRWYANVVPLTKKSLGVPDDSFLFICAANARRMKGIKYLLEATYLLPVNSNIHLMLVGRGMDTPEFKHLIDKSPLKNNIHLLGYRSDVLQVVKSADAFVLASITGEAITKAVIEAMSMGICPLITDISGNKKLVVDKVSGRIVPPKDPSSLASAMIELSKNREQAKQFGTAAIEHIRKNLNVQDTIVRYDELYQELYHELVK
jgi:glycosyltransferase involved in cell wall biosynthesis